MSAEQPVRPGLNDIEGWTYHDTVTVPKFGRISSWRHKTGANHMHGWDVAGKAAFGLTFRSESANDRGAAHVLEHLVGAGSRKYPCSSALFTSMFRTMTDFANGFTETGRTSYTFVTADTEDYSLMLDVLLEGVYWPLLGEREFIREGARHSLPDAAGAEGYISGTVYNEMLLKLEREDEWISRLLARRSEPSGFAQYRHEGTPEAVPELRYEECLGYHQQWYWPGYAISFSSGTALPDALRRLDSAHSERQEAVKSKPMTACCRGDEQLSGPSRLLGKSWRIAEARFSGNTARDWGRCLALARSWRQAIGREGLDVVGIPALMGGRLAAWCAVRSGSGKADMAELLAEMTVKAPAAQDTARLPSEMVAAHLSERYRGMPDQLRWGLALAPLRVTGIDQAAFWRTGDQAGRDEEALAVTTLEVSGECCCAGTGAWSPERAISDNRAWLGAGVSGDARVLPIRWLRDRDAGSLEFAPPIHGGGAYLSRPGPVRSYQHFALPVDPETACLLQPVSNVMRRRLAGVPEADAIGPCAVRSGTDRRPVVDVVLPNAGGSQESWRNVLQDREAMSEIASEAASRHRQLRAQVITRPAQIASRICAAAVCAAGRANELLSGYSPVRRLQSLLKDAELLKVSVNRLGETLDEASALPVIVGDDAAGAEFRGQRSAAPPSGKPGSSHDCGEFELDAPQIPALLTNSAVSCGAWDADAVPECDWPALLVATAHVQRYLHKRVREDGGAYGVTAQADFLTRTVIAWSQGDPVPGRTIDIYQSMWTEALDQTSEDDVEMAKLMAVQAERGRRTAVTYLVGLGCAARCLGTSFAGPVDLVDSDAMRRAGLGMSAAAFRAMSLPRRGRTTIL
jgi:Insulinase (Peptidase family M16)